MRRLHQLDPEQFEEWRKARMKVGQEKYTDAHLNRYGLVDVMEELLDAVNIIRLARDRAGVNAPKALYELENVLWEAIDHTFYTDLNIPDSLCTDELGGDRIWWSEGKGGNS